MRNLLRSHDERIPLLNIATFRGDYPSAYLKANEYVAEYMKGEASIPTDFKD